jgi:hypothetical protein
LSDVFAHGGLSAIWVMRDEARDDPPMLGIRQLHTDDARIALVTHAGARLGVHR